MKGRIRPTIGLQLTNFIEEYPRLLWRGAADAAEERDVNLMVFQTESWNTPDGYRYQGNVLSSLIHKRSLDAAVIASGTLCNYIPLEEFETIIRGFEPLPIVSVAIPLAGIPSILVDNRKGIMEAARPALPVPRARRPPKAARAWRSMCSRCPAARKE